MKKTFLKLGKKALVLTLAAALSVQLVPANKADAKTKTIKKTVKVKVGKKKKYNVKVASSWSAKWKCTNNKVGITIKDISTHKQQLIIKGKKKGKATITCITKGKKYVFKVKVTKGSVVKTTV